jgi:hypothetical protein
MHLFEVLRVCALWDAPREDRESIPTILSLIAAPAVEELCVNEVYNHFASLAAPRDLTPSNDPNIEEIKAQWWVGHRVEWAKKEARKTRDRLLLARRLATELQRSPELHAIMNFRHSYIAHNLEIPEPGPEQASAAGEVLRVRYGDETKLLESTVGIAEALHLGLNGSSFDWDGAREIARANTASLWKNCTFTIQP